MKTVAASSITLTEVADLCKKYSNEKHHLCAIARDLPLAICICEEAQKDEEYPREYATIAPSQEGAWVTVWHDWKDMKVETLISHIVEELGLNDPTFVQFDSVHIAIYYQSRRLKEDRLS